MSQDLVQRYLRSFAERRVRDGGDDVPKDEDPRLMAGGGHILTLGEVSLILKSLEATTLEHSPEATLPPMLRKTMEYVDHFKKGDAEATLQEMRDRYGLSQYEVGMICNLMPETVDQARVLLPDLKVRRAQRLWTTVVRQKHAELDDAALQTLLDTLRSSVRH